MDLGSHVLFYQVDTFTGRPFHGSPASVFLPDEPSIRGPCSSWPAR